MPRLSSPPSWASGLICSSNRADLVWRQNAGFLGGSREGIARFRYIAIILPGLQTGQPRDMVQVGIGELFRPVLQQDLGRPHDIADRLRGAGSDPDEDGFEIVGHAAQHRALGGR